MTGETGVRPPVCQHMAHLINFIKCLLSWNCSDHYPYAIHFHVSYEKKVFISKYCEVPPGHAQRFPTQFTSLKAGKWSNFHP